MRLEGIGNLAILNLQQLPFLGTLFSTCRQSKARVDRLCTVLQRVSLPLDAGVKPALTLDWLGSLRQKWWEIRRQFCSCSCYQCAPCRTPWSCSLATLYSQHHLPPRGTLLLWSNPRGHFAADLSIEDPNPLALMQHVRQNRKPTLPGWKQAP